MTAAEITTALKHLEIKQVTLAIWLDDMDPRSVRRMCNVGGSQPIGVPPSLAVLLRVMLARPELFGLVEEIATGPASPIDPEMVAKGRRLLARGGHRKEEAKATEPDATEVEIEEKDDEKCQPIGDQGR
jgi:hypothetical protein